MKREHIIALGWITLIGFGGIGLILMHFLQKIPLKDFFQLQFNYLITGLLYGATCGYIAIAIINTSFMNDIKIQYQGILSSLNLSSSDTVFLSLCAGIGEEILFRGALQHWLGVWITSLLFVFIHGYITPKNYKLTFYGILLITFSAGLGYLTLYISIWTAISAHFIYDVLLFRYLTKSKT